VSKSTPVSKPTPRVETHDETRTRQLDALATIHLGLAKHTTFFAPGTKLLDIGHDTFRTYEKLWADSAPIEDAASEVAARIDTEKRLDVVLDARTLKMNPDGSITRGAASMFLEPRGFEQLVQRLNDVFPRGHSMMLALDVDQRADVFNRQVKKLNSERLIMARTRIGPDVKRQWFASVGARYGVADANRVLRDIATTVKGQGLRGNVTYDPATTDVSMTATWHAPHEIDPRVGDVFEVGFKGSTNDAAGGALDFDLLSKCVRCINCTVSVAYIDLVRRVHRGDMTGVMAELTADIARIPAAFGMFAKDWRISRETDVSKVSIYGETYATVEDAINGMVATGRIDVGVGRDATVEMLLTAHEVEAKEAPGDRLASILDALTRAAKDALVADCVRDTLQRQAGALVPVFAGFAAEA
jgi:hypothetical protein